MFLQRSPVFFVVLIGVIVSLVRWRRHPKVSLVTIIALLIYVIRFFVFTGLYYSVPQITTHLSAHIGPLLFATLDVLNDIASAVVIVLLVVAAFMKRKPA
jgi:hypothetical protein